MNHVETQCFAPSLVKVSHFNLHRNIEMQIRAFVNEQ